MKHIYKNAQENANGSINCLIQLGYEWVAHTQDPTFEYELHEESDWPDIKPCDQSDKDAHEEQQLMDQASAILESTLDNKAKEYGYDNIKTAVTYADEPIVEKFQLEGIEFRKWRSLVYAYGYEQLARIESGESITLEEFEAGIPSINL